MKLRVTHREVGKFLSIKQPFMVLKIVCVKIMKPEKISESLLVTYTVRTEPLMGRGLYTRVSFIYVGYSLCGLVNAYMFVCMLSRE